MRSTIIPAVFILFRRGNTILMGRRLGGWGSGLLCPPSGHVEQGESFSDAAIREALEEVGIEIAPESLKPFHIISRNNSEGHERIDVYFTVDSWSGEFVNKEPDKCSELVWVPLDTLSDDTVPIARTCIERGLKGLFYSEDWAERR